MWFVCHDFTLLMPMADQLGQRLYFAFCIKKHSKCRENNPIRNPNRVVISKHFLPHKTMRDCQISLLCFCLYFKAMSGCKIGIWVVQKIYQIGQLREKSLVSQSIRPMNALTFFLTSLLNFSSI